MMHSFIRNLKPVHKITMRWLLWRSEKSSLMCHDAMIVFWDLKNVHTSVMRHWLLLRFENVHKCAMVHWLFLRNATWSHMCHDALMFLRCVECSHVSRCTDSFWDLKIVHTCVMLQWPTEVPTHDAYPGADHEDAAKVEYDSDDAKDRDDQDDEDESIMRIRMTQRMCRMRRTRKIGRMRRKLSMRTKLRTVWTTTMMTRTGLKCPTEVPNSKWGWGWQRWRRLWWHWWGLRSPNEVPNASRGPTGNRYPNDPSWSKIVGSCTIWTPCSKNQF